MAGGMSKDVPFRGLSLTHSVVQDDECKTCIYLDFAYLIYLRILFVELFM